MIGNELHPELVDPVKAAFDFRPTMGKLPVGDVEARRASAERGSGVETSRILGVTSSRASVPVADGAAVPLRIYQPTGGAREAGLVYIHGGGMIAGSLETGEPRARAIASATGLTVFSVGYRLAPEHPYPTPFEDCYASLVWAQEQAPAWGVDPRRIGIGGESAGGGLAAGVALAARDRNGPHPAALYLGCPMLDPSTVREPAGGTQWYTWSHLDNETGWRAYLPALTDLGTAPAYAAAALAPDLRGLPSTYIDVGGLDLFRDESIAFCSRLWQAGVACELHVIPGAPHGFTSLAPHSSLSKRVDDWRNGFLSNY